jgi:hypothetical protein
LTIVLRNQALLAFSHPISPINLKADNSNYQRAVRPSSMPEAPTENADELEDILMTARFARLPKLN